MLQTTSKVIAQLTQAFFKSHPFRGASTQWWWSRRLAADGPVPWRVPGAAWAIAFSLYIHTYIYIYIYIYIYNLSIYVSIPTSHCCSSLFITCTKQCFRQLELLFQTTSQVIAQLTKPSSKTHRFRELHHGGGGAVSEGRFRETPCPDSVGANKSLEFQGHVPTSRV